MKKQVKKSVAKNAKQVKPAAKPEKPYGIKAYGSWNRFATEAEYKAYLEEWIDNTEGHEQDRAITAMANLLVGKKTTDTDTLPEAEPIAKRARVAELETQSVAEPVEKPEPIEKPVAEEKKPLTPEEKRAKRNEYARKYYEAHREKLAEASRLCHARKRAELKALKEAEKRPITVSLKDLKPFTPETKSAKKSVKKSVKK